MKISILILVALLTGCMAIDPDAEMGFPCNPSCVLLWKYADTIPRAPGDTDRYTDEISGLRIGYHGILEDGREWLFERNEYDTLKVGDTITGCNLDRARLCGDRK